MDYDYLKASDGTGDATLMHIMADRSIGDPIIDVDVVTGVPSKFIATSGTLLASGFIDPTTKCDFTGHLDGSDLVIDDFMPGSVDNGNTEGQIVVIKPNTSWADGVVALARVAHGVDGNLNATTLGKIYPVGCIYTSTVATNPATVFGFGTWVAFGAGRVLVGKAASGTFGTAGATGGAETHTLTTAEIPSHHHTYGSITASVDNDRGSNSSLWSIDNTSVYDTGDTGGGGAHNNLQPYIVVYMWNRTA